MNRRLILPTALLFPALLVLSCKDDGNSNPVGPNTPNTPTAKVAPPSARGVRITNVDKIRLTQPSAAKVAEAVKADLAVERAVTTTTNGPHARHDPTVAGMRVDCVDGADFGYPPGTSDPFRNDQGCELNTMGGGAAIALPTSNQTRGKKVANVRRLEFYYAGGPQNGGAPRFSLFTDFCEAAPVPTAQTNGGQPKPCGPGRQTDGVWDETLFIDVNGCNDGDVYTGALLLKSIPNSKSDPTCNIYETYGADRVAGDPDGPGPLLADEHVHPNWSDYIGAHPGDRFAANFGASNNFAAADNFIIADVPVHYLVYRIKMQGGSS